MAQRYVHSGAELEKKAYLERVGYVVEEKPEQRILPRTCPHCQAANSFGNVNCDFCGMPLQIEDYRREIEKKRNVESLYLNLNRISNRSSRSSHRGVLRTTFVPSLALNFFRISPVFKQSPAV
jgi:hypothetical protein